MTEVMTFADALGRSDPGKRKLLLSNSFSVAWQATAFTYRPILKPPTSCNYPGRRRCSGSGRYRNGPLPSERTDFRPWTIINIYGAGL